jgi:hypothetical protein
LTSAISSARLAGERIAYCCPQIGFAHQLQWTPGADQVDAVEPVRARPRRAVALGVHEVPGGEGEDVGPALGRAGGRAAHAARIGRIGEREPRDAAGLAGPAPGERVDQLDQGPVRLAEQGILDAVGEIELGVVGNVRAGGDDGGARGAGMGAHPPGRLAGVGQAHLGEEVEAVLEEHHEARPVAGERLLELVLPLGQRGVEQGHLVAVLPQVRGGVERPQGRIRLHLLDLLGIVAQEEGVAEKDVTHGWRPFREWREL